MVNTAKSLSYPIKNSLNNVTAVVDADLQRVMCALLGEDYSDNSRRALISDIKHFFLWYTQVNGETFQFDRVTERDIRDYRDTMKKELSVATVNRRLISLRRFFEVAQEADYMQESPAKKIKSLSTQPLAPKGLTQQETRQFLKEVELRKNLRDRAMIELMVGAGLRVSEVVALIVDDVKLSERKGYVTVRNAKGNKTRKVPLSRSVRLLLSEYLQEQQPTQSLFMGQRGPLTALAVNKVVEKYAKKAGLKLSPHILRHTFAYNYLKEHPGDIVALAQMLGHSNINTTAIYTQNRMEDLQEKVEDLHP